MKADKAVLKAFKGIKAKKEKQAVDLQGQALETALKELRTEMAREAVTTLHRYLSGKAGGGEAAFPVEALTALVGSRLVGSAEHVFGEAMPHLISLPFEEIVPLATTPRCLSQWLVARAKTAGTKESGDRKALMDLALADTGAAVKTVLAQWFIVSASAEELPGAAEFFEDQKGAGWFVGREELLALALERDISGGFALKHFLHVVHNPDALSSELSLIRSNAKLFDEVARVFPTVVEKDATCAVVGLLPGLFVGLPRSTGTERRLLSGRLTKLASSLLAVASSKQVNTALQALDSVSQSMASTIATGSVDMDACGIRFYGQERAPTGMRLSEDGAKLLTIAMRKIRDGMDSLATLSATAFNLGMRQISRAGETVNFDPIHHEDTVGGTLPGDGVIVIEGGWLLGSQVIERAKVRKV